MSSDASLEDLLSLIGGDDRLRRGIKAGDSGIMDEVKELEPIARYLWMGDGEEEPPREPRKYAAFLSMPFATYFDKIGIHGYARASRIRAWGALMDDRGAHPVDMVELVSRAPELLDVPSIHAHYEKVRSGNEPLNLQGEEAAKYARAAAAVGDQLAARSNPKDALEWHYHAWSILSASGGRHEAEAAELVKRVPGLQRIPEVQKHYRMDEGPASLLLQPA